MAKIWQGFSPRQAAAPKQRVAVLPRQAPMRPAAPRPVSRLPYEPPVCLYGAVVVPVGSEREVATGSISNNTGRAIEVREIRFAADATDTSTSFSNLAGVLRAAIAIGGKPVMSEPIPLWSLGRLENVSAQNYVVAAGQPLATQYVWRLARPCVLPPRCAISVKFSHPGTINFPITGRVGFLGKFVEQGLRVTAVPYALAWQSKNVGIAADADVSDDRALTNSLGRAFQVTRIIARHAILASGVQADPTDPTLSFVDGHSGPQPHAVAPVMSLIRMKLSTSRNWPIINDYQPIWDVFGVPGAIEVPHVLPPGDFYTAATKFYTADADSGIAPAWAGGTPKTFQHAAHLSFLGWREESL